MSTCCRINEMEQPTSTAVRNRRFIEKLKSTGNFNAFKQKKAEYEKARRQRLKESLAKLSDSQRTQALRQGRLKSLARVKKYREKRRQASDTQIDMEQQISSSCAKVQTLHSSLVDNNHSVPTTCGIGNNGGDASEQCISSSCSPSQCYSPKSSHTKINFDHSYKTYEELAEAVAKVEKSLPMSSTKRKAVIAKLFYGLDEKSQREIVQNIATMKRTGHKRIGPALIEEIHKFYERDDISRMSANVDDLINFINLSTGQKELVRMRHLVCTLKQAYALFIKENKEASVSLAKFCSLRPAHVKLCSKDFDVTSMLQVDFTESVSNDVPEEIQPIRCKKHQTFDNRWNYGWNELS